MTGGRVLINFWDQVNPGDFLQGEIEGYDKPVRQLYRTILSRLSVDDMLEVGCGPGVDYIGAAVTCPEIRYTGVDYTEQMIEHCRASFPKGTFLQGNIFDLPFQDGEFSLVYCKDVLNHLDNWAAAFQELVRVSNRYVLVNFFDGLGATTKSIRTECEGGYIDHFYDWNEVMTTLTALRPASMTIHTVVCPPNGEETMILFEKNSTALEAVTERRTAVGAR
jgi:ubiquinone/menaquinone biosynthesis C-methylase UbiE